MEALPILGATGPENVKGIRDGYEERAERLVRDVIEATDAEIYVAGGANGIDSMFTRLVAELRPDSHNLVIAPGTGRYSYEAMEFADEVVWAPKGRTDAESFMYRNDAVVARLAILRGVLAAFPPTQNEFIRSGYWATVRRARKAGVETMIVPLNGAARWTEMKGVT